MELSINGENCSLNWCALVACFGKAGHICICIASFSLATMVLHMTITVSDSMNGALLVVTLYWHNTIVAREKLYSHTYAYLECIVNYVLISMNTHN